MWTFTKKLTAALWWDLQPLPMAVSPKNKSYHVWRLLKPPSKKDRIFGERNLKASHPEMRRRRRRSWARRRHVGLSQVFFFFPPTFQALLSPSSLPKPRIFQVWRSEITKEGDYCFLFFTRQRSFQLFLRWKRTNRWVCLNKTTLQKGSYPLNLFVFWHVTAM